ADAFLTIGATAAIAPQWSVDDKVARQFANDLYRNTLIGDERVEVAEFLRSQRAAITAKAVEDGDVGVSEMTRLAYAFFGHPCFAFD
ncbi:MAG: hypothetical protein JWM24_633, partial [Solirubrobacterales bacterium]|nr:hypothetical protein [Solirubrobacterales bacterium]